MLLFLFHVARLLGRNLFVAWPLCRRPLYFLPVLVRPRSSRCLCTGLTIQLIRASCRDSDMLGWLHIQCLMQALKIKYNNSCYPAFNMFPQCCFVKSVLHCTLQLPIPCHPNTCENSMMGAQLSVVQMQSGANDMYQQHMCSPCGLQCGGGPPR